VEAVRPPLGFRSLQAADLTTWQGDEQHPGFQHLLADIRSSLSASGSRPSAKPREARESSTSLRPGEKHAQAEPGERVTNRAKPQAPPGPTFYRKQWITVFGAVLIAAAGVALYETGKESPPIFSPPPDTQGTSGTIVAPPTEPAAKPDQPEVTVRLAVMPPKDQHGQTFRDCDECPEMVVIPAATFTMGSSKDEKERQSDEGPQHQVTIEPFAIGKTEVTFAEWDACVAAGGCNGYKPSDQGWGRGSRPVVNVSWKDAKAYVSWLSQYTGKPYRLPLEAEWEYAARAGTTTPYAFGAAITHEDANYDSNIGKTTEVGAYLPNAWGLYNMPGNVSEWVEDVWHKSYEGAPANGATWMDGKEEGFYGRVNRGGSWGSYPWALRSASRGRGADDLRNYFLGFRVVQTHPK
jgi:formylglycine-generating enzyme required for sulfatase activity